MSKPDVVTKSELWFSVAWICFSIVLLSVIGLSVARDRHAEEMQHLHKIEQRLGIQEDGK